MNSKSGFLTLPTAIVIAAAIIAIAIIWVFKPATPAVTTTKETVNTGPVISIKPLTAADHILGNPNAPIVMLEYSDTSCPYCRIFNTTMEKVMDTYGATGTVAWAYRNYPLDTPDPQGNILHPNANHESQAMECASEVGGNAKYWAYLKRLYEVTPSVTSSSPKGLDQSQLPIIAKYVGLDVAKFNACLDSGKMKEKIIAQQLDATNAGVNGTPFTIFILRKPAGKTMDEALSTLTVKMRLPSDLIYLSNDRMKLAMSGAMPYDVIRVLIEAILAN